MSNTNTISYVNDLKGLFQNLKTCIYNYLYLPFEMKIIIIDLYRYNLSTRIVNEYEFLIPTKGNPNGKDL